MSAMFSAKAATTAEALQQAEVALQQSEAWSHPYFWAPFTIVGDAASPMPNAASQIAAR
jgi:CHAT domain-containing protein